ncbi:hypothetical protein A2397_05035 [Candidatus Amesbacteria bacterium RIFOXYB1_FULL_44_23]|uniref:Uncharacterized protein n=1 Tax=Candidatus Amesbacteria bacterium RIFOXYB1_FULL_44_23 TaxID=1797263 RepID=A0A1F4ZRC4_9BACT|nr:MAG: hypothetical protein A2397_05035 [Candidatus Amesbacteria bacterium RIFOXYB1_FULL_44_23]
MPETASRIKVRESPDVIERYEQLKKLGREMFADSHLLKTGEVNDQDVVLARQLMQEMAKEIKPAVWSVYWEHVIIAPKLGRRIAEQFNSKAGAQLNPQLIEFSLWLHDVGVAVTPAYNRKDWIGDSLMQRIGLPETVLKSLASTHQLMIASEGLHLTDAQAKLEQDLTPEQETLIDQYFAGLSPAQRITNLADNLGKRDSAGLFTVEAFRQYLTTQESRYSQTSPWPSVNFSLGNNSADSVSRRPAGAVLQYYTIQKTMEWLKSSGVNFEEIQHSLADYGPRFIVVARHGDLDNPSKTVYTRDADMKGDIIHLSELGQTQMRELSDVLNKRRFKCTKIASSPETRAVESAEAMASQLAVPIKVDARLDDNFAPGPFIEGMSLDQLAQSGGNVYDEQRWGKYNHEQPKAVIARTQSIFKDTANGLNVGETAILVTHGDPASWLLNSFKTDGTPTAASLRTSQYPAKGEGILVILDPDSHEVFSSYSLTPNRSQIIY